MRLVQFLTQDGKRGVGCVVDNSRLHIVEHAERIYDLAMEAGRKGSSLEALVSSRLGEAWADYDAVMTGGRLLPPLDHPDPVHCFVTGTGLTHLGSAQARDSMHSDGAKEAPVSDSMRLFQWGLEGGKPGEGQISIQPEWFYKGNGHIIVAPGKPLLSPNFALDGGEEAELVGLYIISDSGEVLRVGFALGNEFSDHVMEAQNYLYLAHSKLRMCSFGPELRIGKPPARITGEVRVERAGKTLWQEPFLTGEEHMSYSIANLQHHHFKYPIFRQPGDLHCHFFGTATLSRNAGVATQDGDVFEITAEGFGRPLRNPMMVESRKPNLVQVRTL